MIPEHLNILVVCNLRAHHDKGHASGGGLLRLSRLNKSLEMSSDPKAVRAANFCLIGWIEVFLLKRQADIVEAIQHDNAS